MSGCKYKLNNNKIMVLNLLLKKREAENITKKKNKNKKLKHYQTIKKIY
jgi:hypothetical protein